MIGTAARTPRKADRVADDLLRRIVAGEHTVGSILPREAELAEEYEVNRSVVREAIKLLEVHRLVRPVRPDTGALRAVGTIVHRGQRTGVTEARMEDARGRLYAHGTSTCLILGG